MGPAPSLWAASWACNLVAVTKELSGQNTAGWCPAPAEHLIKSPEHKRQQNAKPQRCTGSVQGQRVCPAEAHRVVRAQKGSLRVWRPAGWACASRFDLDASKELHGHTGPVTTVALGDECAPVYPLEQLVDYLVSCWDPGTSSIWRFGICAVHLYKSPYGSVRPDSFQCFRAVRKLLPVASA